MVEAATKAKPEQKLSEQAKPKPPKAPMVETFAALRFLISGESRRNERKKADGTDMILFQQHAFIIGGPTNIPFIVTHNDEAKCVPEGCYALPSNCFVVNQYGALELERWSLEWKYLREMNDEELSLFKSSQTDLQDFM